MSHQVAPVDHEPHPLVARAEGWAVAAQRANSEHEVYRTLGAGSVLMLDCALEIERLNAEVAALKAALEIES